MLRGWLRTAVDSPCIPEWEFESLVGWSRVDARTWLEAGVAYADVDAHLDQVITMLSMVAGAVGGGALGDADQVGSAQLAQLIEKLFWSSDEARSSRGELQSSVSLRPSVHAQRAPAAPTVRSKPVRKRRAAQR
ncbi:MAG: hypothetical protein JWN48_2369 [Myxococcaceae bacterium]|nr:hypothetical protein [Myxococcaceae bacterium]